MPEPRSPELQYKEMSVQEIDEEIFYNLLTGTEVDSYIQECNEAVEADFDEPRILKWCSDRGIDLEGRFRDLLSFARGLDQGDE